MPGTHTLFFKNNGHRAKPGKRWLQKIYADESREKQPVWTMHDGKYDAKKDKTAGHCEYDTI